MLELILFTFNQVAPIFLLIAIGKVLRIKNLLTQSFGNVASKFIFNISLPALVFSKISGADLGKSFDIKLISYAVLLTLTYTTIAWIFSFFLTQKPEEKGTFTQGSFRSNFAIVGLALILNLGTETEFETAIVVLSVIMPLYNILGVIILTLPHHRNQKINFMKIILDIIKNPLIISINIAFLFSLPQIKVPFALSQTLNYLGILALPLALLNIGASLNFESFKRASNLSITATFLKTIFNPALGITIAILIGFSGSSVLILFILFGSPTAIASYIMAKEMKGSGELAGDIIALTTLTSILTLSIGIVILKSFGFI